MRARILSPGDVDVVQSLLARDPVCNVFVSSRVDTGVLWPGGSGVLWGWPADRPRHLVHAGSNLVPVINDDLGDDPAEVVGAFAEALGPRRNCQAIVGPAPRALALFERLSSRWGAVYARAREVRPNQPVMLADAPMDLGPVPVRRIAPEDFESYVVAAAAMYAEEVGQDPMAFGARAGYRSHCRTLIEQGRAFGIVTDGHVVFKADIGAASGKVAQIQGVWLAPHLRGRNLAAPAMAGVTAMILQGYPLVSLYVNDFNLRAIQTYRRAGYRQVGTFATVLY